MESMLTFLGIAYFIIGIFVYALIDLEEVLGKAKEFLFLIPQNSSYVFLAVVLLWPLFLLLSLQSKA
jgi:hypothetical protein